NQVISGLSLSYPVLSGDIRWAIWSARDQCNQHLACQPHERVVALERHSLCKLIFTPRPSRCAYTLDKYVNDKLKIIRAFPVTILVVGNEISLADRKCT
ncbi:hypothetical protein, partial [Escherichia coli]|uniref:hypothetical protein n=1 Tax=Escherichia coli TaxID=562 RepID=UPI001A8D5F41